MTYIAGSTQTATATTSTGIVDTPAPAYLTVLDPQLDRAPTTLTVAMAGLEPLASVTFTIYGLLVGTATADINGEIQAVSLNIDRRFGATTHTVVGTSAAHSGSGTFTLARNPSQYPVNQTSDADPVYIAAARGDNGVYKWVLQDLMPGGLGSWVMPINPSSMSNPHVRKNVGAVHSTSLAGSHHLYEGATPLEWEFAGFCPNQDFQNRLIAYSELPRRFYLIDHRNRAWIVAFAGLDLRPRKRVRDDRGVSNDWLADYSVKAVLYSQKPKTPVGA